MIEANNLIAFLVQSYPPVRDQLVKTVDDWLGDDGNTRPCMVMSAVGWLVEERLGKGEYEGADRLFDLVDRILIEGSPALREAASTCFLENLMNRAESLDPQLYVPLLGPASREYCRAWDEFAGVKTAGLYEEAEESPVEG